MTGNLRRGLASAAIAPLLLVGVAACGSDDGSDASGSHGSDTSGTSAGSAVLTGLKTGDEVDPGDFVDTVAKGVEKSTTAHVTMEMGGVGGSGMKGEGDIDYTSKKPSMEMSLTTPGVQGEQKTILVDGIMYIQAPELGGDTYYKIDPSDPDSPLASMGMGSVLDQADPAGQLEKLRPAIDKVSYAGKEDVDGRELGHYELTVNMPEVMKAMGGELPSAAASAMPKTVTYDLWLDDQDRFAQMTMDYPLMGREISVTMVVDDWGKKVSIEAPPADQVKEFDLSAMVPGASTGA